MSTVLRWRKAQQYEQGFWDGMAAQIAEGSASQLDWYNWRAEQLCLRLKELGRDDLTTGSAAVIEVGSGPIGVISFFAGTRRVAVDPLQDFYAKNPVLSELRDSKVEYTKGMGESLPVPDQSFDLVIIENCIDHVHDVDTVMRELRRVLKDNGILYLTVNNRSPIGYYVHRVLSRLRIDAGHPHTFTPPRVRQMFERNGFQVARLDSGSYSKAVRADLTSSGLRGKLKALLGVSEYVVYVYATKRK